MRGSTSRDSLSPLTVTVTLCFMSSLLIAPEGFGPAAKTKAQISAGHEAQTTTIPYLCASSFLFSQNWQTVSVWIWAWDALAHLPAAHHVPSCSPLTGTGARRRAAWVESNQSH